MKLDHFNTPSVSPVEIASTLNMTCESYPNEGLAIKVDNYYQYIKYSNGDRIFLKIANGEYVVNTVYTHDKCISTSFNKNPFGKPSERNYRFEDGHGNVIIWSSEILPDSELNKNYTLKAVI